MRFFSSYKYIHECVAKPSSNPLPPNLQSILWIKSFFLFWVNMWYLHAMKELQDTGHMTVHAIKGIIHICNIWDILR